MNRRSRGGCIDCRKAKVKCDEIKPHCGTCKRRRHVCQGYTTVTTPTSRGTTGTTSLPSAKVDRQHRRHPSVLKQLPPNIISLAATATATTTAEEEEGKDDDDRDKDDDSKTQKYGRGAMVNGDVSLAVKRPFSRFNEPVTTGFSSTTVPKAGHPLIMDPTLMTPRALGLIPPGVVSSTDRPTVELYFTRHPYELNISPEFVNEMNANVLAILQQSPHAIVDSLSAIGHSYLTSSEAESSLTVLNYRARILATLRAMQLSDYNLEVMVFMLLGLSAIELVDCTTTAPETTIPAVIANSASLISHHISTGREISSLARYFIRALARQDMIISLIHLHRPMIPTSVWMDETAQTSVDRLMGYTATLMPLLEELCSLAEDIKTLLRSEASQQPQEYEDVPLPSDALLYPSDTSTTDIAIQSDTASWSPRSHSHSPHPYCHTVLDSDCTGDRNIPSPSYATPMTPLLPPILPPIPTGPDMLAGFAQRAENLRLRIQNWKPCIAHGLSFRNSRRYLSQAACYRSGALLYLFRLLNPPHRYENGRSIPSPTTIDGEATARAHEVLMSTTVAAGGPDRDEVKMLLWPVFLAACEMSAEEDRQMVLDILDAIMAQRRTVTAQRTKSFVLNRVWPARDEGQEWNWMVLAQQYPGECLPI